MPGLNLYVPIHKGLRSALSSTLITLGRADWNDQEAAMEAAQGWRLLRSLLWRHAENERLFIHPLLGDRTASEVRLLEAEHDDFERSLDDADALLRRLEETGSGGRHEAMGLELYRAVARLWAAYEPHLEYEETRIMGALWELATPEELMGALQAILRGEPLEELLAVGAFMVPASSPAERVGLYGGLRATLPPEDYQRFADLAERLLPPPQWMALQAALEGAAAPTG